MLPEPVEEVIRSLQLLPGVGAKNARRLATHLLERNPQGADRIAHALLALKRVGRCERCRNWADTQQATSKAVLGESDQMETLCRLCRSSSRLASTVCVVESPADVMAMEATGVYKGLYFVLHGLLSPIAGIGPETLGLHQLQDMVESGGVTEVVLALSSTMDGEVTAQYISDALAQRGEEVTISRLARGVPVGGELDYIDSSTLAVAMNARSGVPVRPVPVKAD